MSKPRSGEEFTVVGLPRQRVDGRAKAAITAAFARAKAAGKWPGAYARTNEQEFFAEVWPKMAIEGGRPYLLPGFSVPN